MQTLTPPWNNPDHFTLQVTCPYYDARGCSCQASCSGMPVGRARRQRYCFSENHDSCPLFLARMLRNSQPRRGLDLREHLQK